jgi:hypothetical protein
MTIPQLDFQEAKLVGQAIRLPAAERSSPRPRFARNANSGRRIACPTQHQLEIRGCVYEMEY